MIRLITCIGFAIGCIGTLAAPAAAQPAKDASNYLIQCLTTPAKARNTIASLRAANDKDLIPFFVAMTTSSDQDRRRMGVDALIEQAGADGAPALLEVFLKDSSMDLRSDALVGLLELKAISNEQLVEALKINDERIRCLCARALVQKGQGSKAIDTLKQLTISRELATAGMAKMSLLGMGQTDQLPAVRNILVDSNTPPVLLNLLLKQMAEEKVFPVVDAAREVARTAELFPIKLQAYKSVAALSTDGSASLGQAIAESNDLVLGVALFLAMGERMDSQAQIKTFAASQDVLGALARLELARKAGGDAAAKAAMDVVNLEHPIVIDYVLERARQDMETMGDKADFYTPALLKFIGSVAPSPRRIEAEHLRAAQATTILVDMGTPAAVAGLKKIMDAGNFDGPTRSAAVGMLKAKNRVACDLIKPLLKNAYPELATDAALVLGKFGDVAGQDFLGGIVARPNLSRPEMVAICSWYLIKIAGQTKQMSGVLTNLVK